MQLKSVGKGGRRLLKSLLERSKLCYLKAGWDRSGANMLDAGLEKATQTHGTFLFFKNTFPLIAFYPQKQNFPLRNNVAEEVKVDHLEGFFGPIS